MAENIENRKNTLEKGTYEIIQGRLQKHKTDLQQRLNSLNEVRKNVFGGQELQLLANERINTDNQCTARDIVTIGDHTLFGYNVHFGLRTNIKLSDVFTNYEFKDGLFKETDLDLLEDPTFITDFKNLYKYYRNTIFSKFSVIENYLYMVFQVSDKPEDIKAFKWLIRNGTLAYIDNRSDHEYVFPNQHEYVWTEPDRDMHRYGDHPHVSILDKVFVEAVGGDITIKIEDNTSDGRGIYSEPVQHMDQTLDDAEYHYADLGNLTVFKIKPYQEEARYFVYNHKVKEVHKIESIKDTAILLPDNQGLLFPNGYYLQTGDYKLFEKSLENVTFQQRIAAPNGEDFLYVYYQKHSGALILMFYNIIDQEIKTPIICNGFTLLENGELCYFKTDEDATKHHMVQIWQTPFTKREQANPEHKDSLVYKIGNKELVKAMAECQEVIRLLNKQDSYNDLYGDLTKESGDILDSYYWIAEKDTFSINEPLVEIRSAANAAIDEFEKVKQLKKTAFESSEIISQKSTKLFESIKYARFQNINEFVGLLTELRTLRGETISLYEIRYTDEKWINKIEESIIENQEIISQKCVHFLLDDKALLPYQKRVDEKEKEIDKLKKLIEAKKLREELDQIGTDLEMLIEIVNNLKIEDTSHATEIIDRISTIFSKLNQIKIKLKNSAENIGIHEAKADFAAQIKLFDQSILNFLDVADTPEKCDDYLGKLAIQLEELEGKFADYDVFIQDILTKREEVYTAFETRKNSLVDKRNKRTIQLEQSSLRILKGISKKALSMQSNEEINGYFASDLMISKVRDLIKQLKNLDAIGKAETIETALKTSKEEALRSLKDKSELYEDGDSVIKFGTHKFGVNKQNLELSIVQKEDTLFYHLNGTDFYQEIKNDSLMQYKSLWNQELISENENIYRSEYLAYNVYKDNENNLSSILDNSVEQNIELIQNYSSERYSEGYIKGIHDIDAAEIFTTFIKTGEALKALKFHPEVRAWGSLFWKTIADDTRIDLDQKIKSAGTVLSVFPDSDEFTYLIEEISEAILTWEKNENVSLDVNTKTIASYLIEELQEDQLFTISNVTQEHSNAFGLFLKENNALQRFKSEIEQLESIKDKINLALKWIRSYFKKTNDTLAKNYHLEIALFQIFDIQDLGKTNATSAIKEITGLKGSHQLIENGSYLFNYHEFLLKMENYFATTVPAFHHLREIKHHCIVQQKEELKLEEFEPRVLSSFVRNKLIDKVYLPLIGDNLAKQLGTVGENKRTDRMGMLLLISPPGYGKTTLMEYIANRLGLIFMKINGPAIGHEVTSVDPESAPNSAAREELKKLNLAFEMGNNVMAYIDDIQHCHPEFLQKFISLADGQRKIEGTYNGRSKTYDFRGKKFCVIMAGNPYTESGDKFQIPDMLSNRADIYNLGDVIGDTASLFELSLIENSLSSNPTLRQLTNKNFDDLYSFIEFIESGENSSLEFDGNHTKSEVEDYLSVLRKVIAVRDTVLKVNALYIKSAAMEDEYRKEPAFKLQGSYRDMNKLSAKVIPIMNDKELQTLVNSHYDNEAQTLTATAEANLLKYREITGQLSNEDIERWDSIKETFNKNNVLKGFGNENEMAQILAQLMRFTAGIEGIRDILGKNKQ